MAGPAGPRPGAAAHGGGTGAGAGRPPGGAGFQRLASRDGLSLVRITLHTGRTHQIRVQFASRGFPLVGDRKYGGAGDGETLALWSWRLGFTHPETGRSMVFTHQPPAAWPWTLFPLPETGR